MTMSPSTIVRADLLKLIERELLGPRYGDDEEIKGTPRAAYVVGALAPVTVDPSMSTATGSESGDPNETGVAINDSDAEHSDQRGVLVNTDEEPGAAEEDEERDEGPKGALTHPSSMGLRFQVPLDCGRLRSRQLGGDTKPSDAKTTMAAKCSGLVASQSRRSSRSMSAGTSATPHLRRSHSKTP